MLHLSLSFSIVSLCLISLYLHVSNSMLFLHKSNFKVNVLNKPHVMPSQPFMWFHSTCLDECFSITFSNFLHNSKLDICLQTNNNRNCCWRYFLQQFFQSCAKVLVTFAKLLYAIYSKNTKKVLNTRMISFIQQIQFIIRRHGLNKCKRFINVYAHNYIIRATFLKQYPKSKSLIEIF